MKENRAEKMDLKQKAYISIKEKIIAGEFKPGQDISEEKIQNELGISRTPIREALMRLQTENLIEIFPRKGIFVSNITQKVIKNVFQIRLMIEPQVIRIVGTVISKEWLKTMKEKFQKQFETVSEESILYYVELDKEFHSHLINACDNQYLVNVMNNIFDQNQRMRYQTYSFNERNVATKSEHIAIIESLINDDLDTAEKLMKDHIKNAEEISLRYIMI